MNSSDQKGHLRKSIAAAIAKMNQTQKLRASEQIWEQIAALPAFQQARCVLAYWSMEDEVVTRELMLSFCKEKILILPVVKGDVLELRYFDGVEKMNDDNFFRIREPKGKTFEHPEEIDLIIVPGRAFDKEGNRLGRGRGYYDKLLSTTNSYTIGVGFSCQMVESVPHETHDVALDQIIHD